MVLTKSAWCAALVAFASVVSGAPTADAGKFSIEQVKNTKHAKSGPLALAKAYQKFGAPLPDDLAQVVDKVLETRDTGSATTRPQQYDSEWLTPVKIGTPAQTLMLDFDTGSSDLWVFSTETSRTDGQTEYSPSSSRTSSKLRGYSWDITYGDQSSSSGDVYTDKVTVGGLTVDNQAVEAAQQVSSQFVSESDLDGLLGLAYSSINTVSPQQQKTFFDNAMPNLDSPVFTADLKHGAPGKYNFGYIDDGAYNGDITYTDVNTRRGFWEFTSSGYGVGNDLYRTSIDGIADTGTTLLMLPDQVINDYYGQVRGAQYYSQAGGVIFPCDSDLPSFTFVVEGDEFTIPSEYMNYAPFTSGYCFGGLQSSSSIGISIYGDIALKATFVVFDGGNNRLGWASKSL